MELVFFCKLLSDLSLYFAFAAYLFAWFGNPPALIFPLLILLTAAVACYSLRQRVSEGLRLLPLGLLLFCLFFAKNIFDFLLLLLPCIYVSLICKRQIYRIDYNTQHDSFMFGIKILPLMLLPSLFTQNFNQLKQGALPFIVLFLICGVLLLRILRHDENTIQQTRFKLMNASAVIACCFLGFELSREVALQTGARMLSLFYHAIISPIFQLFGYALGMIAWLIALLLRFFIADLQVTRPEIEIVDTTPAAASLTAKPPLILPHWLIVLGLAVLIAAILVITILVFRRLLGRAQPAVDNSKPSEIREALRPLKSSQRVAKDYFAPSDPRQAIRFYYRKFLKLYLSMGIPFNHSKTSAQIQEAASPFFEKSLLAQLRKIYVAARYRPDPPTSEEAAQAKKLYLALKAQKPDTRTFEKSKKKSRPSTRHDQYR